MAVVKLGLVELPLFDEKVHAVKGHAAIVADDAAAAVVVRKPGDYVGAPALLDVGGVSVKDAVVVRLAVLGKDFGDFGIRLEAVGLEADLDHAPAAQRHDRPLEG